MPDIFLSYSREDQTVARRYAAGFEREGLTVWWDQALDPGEAFDQVTERALSEAGAVVVLWSKASVNSRWVRAEATQANAAGRLLPVMIEPCTRPIMFELTHTADLTQWKGSADDPAWQGFVASVRRFLQRRASTDSTDGSAPGAQAADTPRRGLRALTQRLANPQIRARLRRVSVGISLVLIGAALAGGIAWQLWSRPGPQVTRVSIDLAGAGVNNYFALSPDGRRIVYPLGGQLLVQSLDQYEPTPVPGSERALHSFFSPDGKSVAFFTYILGGASGIGQLQLKVFDFGSAASRVLSSPVPNGLNATWDPQGRIFFGTEGSSGLYRVAATGGVADEIAALGDYADFAMPEVLPGGDWLLFGATRKLYDWSDSEILAQNLATGERKLVQKGGHSPRYLPTGHLVFAHVGVLHAVAFDAKRIATRGPAVPMVQGVATQDLIGYGAFRIAANGTLAYVPGTARTGAGLRLTTAVLSFDRSGKARPPLPVESRQYLNPRASPDGSRIAVEVGSGVLGEAVSHIWVLDARTGAATQLTSEGDEDRSPVWAADGREVFFTARHGRECAIWRVSADGSVAPRRVVEGTCDGLALTDVHGQTLVYQDRSQGRNDRDLFTFDLRSGGAPRPLLATPADEHSARLSPDGNWVAYVLGGDLLRGEPRVYVRPFPDTATGAARAVLEEGIGLDPAWSPDGGTIYLVSRDQGGSPRYSLMAAPVSATPTTLTLAARRERLDVPLEYFSGYRRIGKMQPYDVLPDGGFIVAQFVQPPASAGTAAEPAANAERPRINVVLNWFEELKKLVPVE